MSAHKVYPEPDFENQRDPDADEGHHALLDSVIRAHKRRPQVWQFACRAAEAKAKKRGHATIQAVIEDARELAEDTRTAEERELEFKIQNAAAAFFSRAMIALGIVPAGFFDCNEQPSKKRKAPKYKQTPAGVTPDPKWPRGKGRK